MRSIPYRTNTEEQQLKLEELILILILNKRGESTGVSRPVGVGLCVRARMRERELTSTS